ncbi:hypothetical protein NMY22_g18552 [Coprinellus aureogranulatus]|nr:hypothetical protein NMY22_g18552 [Coprinellus aureogranulatus]
MLAVLQYYINNNSHIIGRPPSQLGEPQTNTGGPGRLATFAVFVISGLWGGCIAVTLTLRYTRFEGKMDMHEAAVKYVIAGLAGLEAAVCFAIGVYNVGVLMKWWSTKQRSTEGIVAPKETGHLEAAKSSG